QRLEPQTYSFEYGALMLDQPDGAAMVGPPSFSVATTTGQSALAWAFPVLVGGSSAVSGAPAATVTLTPTGTGQSLDLAAQDISITLTTSHPAAWAEFWRARMALAGLSETPVTPLAPCVTLTSSPQFTIPPFLPTATSVTLNFFGPCSAPGDTTRDIQIHLDAGDATVELRPAG
ncbi:MAG: hypothetical protein QOC71_1272, partial [Thermoplasmata archaeon]|nr:hypothetical protein [Thermoplasmata archaeon]